MPNNEISQSGGTARSKKAGGVQSAHSLGDSVLTTHNQTIQSDSRYVVERCPGGGGRAVYAVLDIRRIVTHRVICRTNFADANMIRDALAGADDKYLESHEVLGDLVQLWSEHEALNGGGPGWQKRFGEAFSRACDLVRREP